MVRGRLPPPPGGGVLLARVEMAEQAERACAVLAYGDLKRVELAIALAQGSRCCC